MRIVQIVILLSNRGNERTIHQTDRESADQFKNSRKASCLNFIASILALAPLWFAIV